MISSNYQILKTNGAVTMSEYPYYVNGTYSYNWLNDESAMLNALSTKVSRDRSAYIDVKNTETPITSPTDSNLTEVKQLLCAGKVLVISTRISDIDMSNCSIKNATNGQKAIYRASFNYNCGGHAMTVVGYNDSIQCDFNNDGIIQNSEKGAFKVANSYGTSFGNNGYIWVMYDALNKVSANTTNTWEKSETGTRKPIFDGMGEGKNTFQYIEVQNQTVNLAGGVNFTTANCNKIAFDMKRGASSYTALGLTKHINDRPFNGAFVIDFGTLDDNIINYLSGAGWSVKITNKSGKTMTNISYKIVDNLGATVKNAGTLASSLRSDLERSYAINLNMQLGDVDYSGAITSDDQKLVLSYVVKNEKPSSMQRILADYNQDGDVDIADVIAIGRLLSSNGKTISADLDLIARLYREYAIENGLDADVDVSELMNLPESEKSR